MIRSWFGRGKGTLESIVDSSAGLGKRIGSGAVDQYKGLASFAARKYSKVTGMIDQAVKSRIFQEMYSQMQSMGKKGTTAIVYQGRKLKVQYDAQLDKLVESKPAMTGFIDGWLHAVAATSTGRSDNKEYKRGIRIGKLAGWGPNVVLILNGEYALGLLPAYVHAGKYLYKKWQQAKRTGKDLVIPDYVVPAM